MPKTVQFTRERLLKAAVDIVRKSGMEALSARSLGKKLGCSVAPIFRSFANMEELTAEVHKALVKILCDQLSPAVNFEPAFKEFGLRLIRFSKEEPMIFYCLFMGKQSSCEEVDVLALECLAQAERTFSLTTEQSKFIYAQVWPHVLGLAHLCLNNSETYTDAYVSKILSTQFQALLSLLKSGQEVKDIKPRLVSSGDPLINA